MTTDALLAMCGLLILFYFLVVNRITELVHPMRLDMAELGEFLIESKDLPEFHRARIQQSLNAAYSPVHAWLFAILLPVAVLMAIRESIRARNADPLSDVPNDLRADVRHFCNLSLMSTMANSPLAALFFFSQVAVYMLLWLPVGAILRDSMRVAHSIDQIAAHVSSHFGNWKQAA